MSSLVASHARPPIATVLSTVARAALVATGLVIFLPAAVFLALSSTPGLDDWVAWLIPLMLWFAGLLPLFRAQRVIVQTAAGFLLVLMVFIIPDAGSWISVTTVCFAVIVGAVFNLSTRGAAIVVLIATALDGMTALALGPTESLFGVVQLSPWTGAALQIFAGGGLVIAWHSWMRNVAIADEEFEALRQATASDHQASAAKAGAEAVARRIHETILNTLAALSMGVEPSQREQAIRACQRDLDQMERNVQQLPDSTIEDVVKAALENLRPTPITCSATITGDRLIESAIVNPLHDAIVEALRNVERHSGTLNAQISAEINRDGVSVSITDHGKGPGSVTDERFGLRNSIRANMRSINGAAHLRSNPEGGTTVLLTAPARIHREVIVPTFPILGAADATTLGRFGATGTNLFMLFILIPVVSSLPNPGIVAVANLLYIATVFALALAWTSKARPWLDWLGIGLLAGPFVAASLNPLTCSASPAVQALIAGASGGAVLLLLVANNSLPKRILIYVLAITGPALVTIRIPDECRLAPTLTTGVQVIYLAAIIGVLTWIELRFEAQRSAAQRAWTTFVQEQAVLEHQAAMNRGWANVGISARDLLEGIADQSLQPEDGEVRARAAAENASIRAVLGLAAEVGGPFGVLTRRLVRVAGPIGATVDAEAVTPSERRDRLPEQVVTYLESIVKDSAGQTITLRSFVDADYDEIVISIPNAVSVRPTVQFIDDVVLQSEANLDATVITVRRPIQPTAPNAAS